MIENMWVDMERFLSRKQNDKKGEGEKGRVGVRDAIERGKRLK